MLTVGHTRLHDPTPYELTLIPDDEKAREFGSDWRRQQFLCGRALLRRMLQDETGVAAARHELIRSEGGKPECVGGPAVSITHTADLIACVVAQSGQIGIDLEGGSSNRDTEKIARKFFSAEEAEWLSTQEQDRFYMLWVLKEAYVKAVGRSIFGGINRLQCRVMPPDIEVLHNEDEMRNVGLFELDGVFMALATTEASISELRSRRWNPMSEKMLPDNTLRQLAMSGELRH